MGQYEKPDTLRNCVLKYDSLCNCSYFESVDKMPTYIGGYDSLYSILNRNLKWPSTCCHFEGKIVVSFIIEPNGEISCKRILRGLDDSNTCGACTMILRALDSLTNWNIGQCRGDNVAVQFILPVLIKDYTEY